MVLIEDNPADARLLLENIRDAAPGAFEFVHETRLETGIERARTCAPDAIMLDLSLPDSHGLETFHRARGALSDVPILLVTGLSDQEVAMQAVHAGAQDFVVKGSFDGELFARAIRYAVERHRLSLQLKTREVQQRMTALIEAHLDPIMTVDVEGLITDANEALEVATGRPRADLARTPLSALFVEADRVEGAIREAFAAGSARNHVFTLRHEGGTLTEVLFNASLYHDSAGRPEGVLVAARDITELRRLERETIAQKEAMLRAERLAALGVLVAGVAHEINNPLTYIEGNIETAIMDLAEIEQEVGSGRSLGAVDTRETTRGLRIALAGTARIAHITKALKAVSRTSTRVHQETDLAEVIREVESLVRIGAQEETELRFDLPPGRIPIRGDAAELHQVLLNLVRNALDATEPRGRDGIVHVQATREGSTIEIAVRDNGPGVPAGVRPMLFTPFFTTKPAGTGLGLSISQAIVRDHGGEILLEDAPGGGTLFRVRLPLLPLRIEA